jgi:hypothetical protein
MVAIFHVEDIGSLLGMVGAAEQGIDFFEGYLLRFRDEEPNEDCKADIDGEEEEEGVL